MGDTATAFVLSAYQLFLVTGNVDRLRSLFDPVVSAVEWQVLRPRDAPVPNVTALSISCWRPMRRTRSPERAAWLTRWLAAATVHAVRPPGATVEHVRRAHRAACRPQADYGLCGLELCPRCG